jgi:hypothetical protein
MDTKAQDCTFKTAELSSAANILQDLSDAQYSTFRENIPYVAILLVAQPLLRRVYQTIRPLPSRNGSSKANGKTFISAIEGDARLDQRASFDSGFALIFLTAMHGVSALKVLFILYINFSIGTQLPRRLIPAATWIFNISILFSNELCGGYKFADIVSYIAPGGEEISLLQGWGAWLDGYGGVMSRWEVLFNITVLRLISYNMDYYFSVDRRGGSPIEVSSSLAIVLLESLLMLTRRNNSTPLISLNGIELKSLRQQRTTTFVTTLATSFMPPFT